MDSRQKHAGRTPDVSLQARCSVKLHIAVGEEVQRAVANDTVGEALISGLIVGLPVLLYGLFIRRKA